VEPAAIPDVLADRPVVVFGKYRGPRRGTLTLSGLGGRGPFVKSFDVAATTPQDSHRALPYLWARERIATLSDYGFGGGDEQKPAVVALGLRYNLLTRYTSFIAVRHKVVNPGGGGDDVAQPQPLPAGVEETAVGTESGDEPGLALLALLVALAAAVGWMSRSRGRILS
jgi:Ca-activated chloride channel family protein